MNATSSLSISKCLPRASAPLRLCVTFLILFSLACSKSNEPTTEISNPSGITIIGLQGRTLGHFSAPRGIDVTPSGLMAIADRTGRIQLFGPNYAPIREWPMPKMDNGTPTGVVFDSSDPATTTLLVADTHNSRIMRYSLDGKMLKMFGEYGGEVGHLIYPTNLAVDDKGFIYVTEYGEHDRVLKFDRDANFVKQWGDFGTEPGKFQRPLALIFAPPDRIIVADSCNHRIQEFTTEGELLKVWGEVGREAGKLNYPYDLTLGKDGNLYICEYGNNRIQAFDRDGKSLGCFGGPGSRVGEFATPWGIVADTNGNLRVADTLNHRVQVIETKQILKSDR